MGQEQDVDFESRDFAKQGFSRAELEELIDAGNVGAFLNPRHQMFKANNWKAKPPGKGEAIAAILKDPNVLRRPIIKIGKRYIVGFDPEAYAGLT